MRAAPEQRVARVGAQLAVEPLDADEHAAHARDRVDAEVGPRPVRRAPARLDLERDEALVRDADLLLGRLGDDRAVGGAALERARVVPRLATSSSTTAATTTSPRSRASRAPRAPATMIAASAPFMS